ncbi:MAG: hypothetical protein JWM32_3257 [Verrucomicrobia bacterium]|nr:hypothetical protein [Verrucomicrobiota bacterium]
MPKNYSSLVFVGALALALVGCESAPNKPAPKPAQPMGVTGPKAEQSTEYTNISVSEAKGVSSPFKTEPGTIFPENKMGYRLLLTGGVSMPNLIATEISATEILVQARVYNRSDSPQNLDIIFAVGEDKVSYNAKNVHFPANRARDIKFKLSRQATQNLCLIVSDSH